MDFRNAAISDLEELSKLYSPKTDQQKLNWKKLQEKRINDSLENPNKEFIVALLNGEIIGHFSIDYARLTYPHAGSLVVREDLRNKGYGSGIIEEIEKRIREKGYSKVGISVNPDNNKDAKRLYERLGYKQVSKDKYLDYVDPIDGAEDWVVDLEKELI